MDNMKSPSKSLIPNSNFPHFDTEVQSDAPKSPPTASSPSSNFQNSTNAVSHKRPNSSPFFPQKDYLTTTVKTAMHRRSHSQNETSNDKLQNFDSEQITKRLHRDGFIKNLPLSVSVPNEKENQISTNFQTGAFSKSLSSSIELTSHHQKKERAISIPVNKNSNFLKEKCFTGSRFSISAGDDSDIVLKRSVSSFSEEKDRHFFPEHLYEEIEEDDCQDTIKYPEIDVAPKNKSTNVNRTFSNREELEKVDNQRYTDHQSRSMAPQREKCKIEIEMCDKENEKDDLWQNYIERPLLPLKPLHKQRSMSCTNLVQTIKGLSKRKISATNRHSSPENHTKNILFPEHVLVKKKELSTSVANILDRKTDLVLPRNLPLRNDDAEDYLEASVQTTHQSLHPKYAWFHPVDAKEASKRLLKMQQNGAFLIRPASNPTHEVLYTLCVVFSRCVYNFHVKNLKNGRVTLGKQTDRIQTFGSLLDLIKYHQTVPISINLTERNEVSHVYLLITPSK